MATGHHSFIKDTDARIAARNAAAEGHIAARSGFGKFRARASLWLANGVDRTHALFANAEAALVSGAAFGALRGAMMGVLVGGLFAATGAFVPIVVAFTTIMAIHDGVGEYNHVKSHDPRTRGAKMADWLASKGGALGGVSPSYPSKKAETAEALHRAEIDHSTEKALATLQQKQHGALNAPKQPAQLGEGEQTTEQTSAEQQGATRSFVADENRRRGRAVDALPVSSADASHSFASALGEQRARAELGAGRPNFV